MTTRMTALRLSRLVAAGDVAAVRAAVADAPRLLGATVERDGEAGWTPLHLAVAEERDELIRALVEAGADVGARTDSGRTPLHVALERSPGTVVLLRELGIPVDAPSAAFLDDVDQLTRELDAGADLVDPVSRVDLLAWAAYGGACDAAELLLDRGADPNGGALHAAAAGGHVDLVALLVKAGADVDRRDPDTGRAPLHAAVAGPADTAPAVVEALLSAGADVDATTSDGATALDMILVTAASTRRADADRAGAGDALADLLVAHGATN